MSRFSLFSGRTLADIPTRLEYLEPYRPLSAYLLGTLELDEFLSLQRRLVYEVGGDRTTGSVILCEHPPGVTIGREGSRAHIRPNFEALEVRLRRSEGQSVSRAHPLVRWVSRGGGAMLHLPEQVACYPILPLDLLGISASRYVEELQNIGVELLRRFDLAGTIDRERPGVSVNGRRVVHIGVAIRERITCFGFVVNVNPDLELFHQVSCDGDPLPMTSIRRESPSRIRVSGVRQQLLDLIAARFGFDRVSVFHNHPSTLPRSLRHAAAPSS